MISVRISTRKNAQWQFGELPCNDGRKLAETPNSFSTCCSERPSWDPSETRNSRQTKSFTTFSWENGFRLVNRHGEQAAFSSECFSFELLLGTWCYIDHHAQARSRIWKKNRCTVFRFGKLQILSGSSDAKQQETSIVILWKQRRTKVKAHSLHAHFTSNWVKMPNASQLRGRYIPRNTPKRKKVEKTVISGKCQKKRVISSNHGSTLSDQDDEQSVVTTPGNSTRDTREDLSQIHEITTEEKRRKFLSRPLLVLLGAVLLLLGAAAIVVPLAYSLTRSNIGSCMWPMGSSSIHSRRCLSSNDDHVCIERHALAHRSLRNIVWEDERVLVATQSNLSASWLISLQCPNIHHSDSNNDNSNGSMWV